MKTKRLPAILAMCCVVAALAGCASTDRKMSRSFLDEKRLERDKAPPPTGSSQPVIPDDRALRKLDLDTNGAVTLENWRDFDKNVEAKENFGTLDEDGLQINPSEFFTQAPAHSQLSISGVSDTTTNDFSWDGQEFQPQGLRLFSIRF